MSYAILVSSCDSFEDCWAPFCALLKAHWKYDVPKIYFVTETKTHTDMDLNLRAIPCGTIAGKESCTWGECLSTSLASIAEEFVLYLQEDYFLDSLVDLAVLSDALALIKRDQQIAAIGLSRYGGRVRCKYENDARFGIVERTERYLVSTQASLWRRTSLASIVRGHENGWMFEIFGSWRARMSGEVFLRWNPSPEETGQTPPLSYIHTGVIKGKWHPEVPALFARHGISVDTSRRGIYKPQPAILRKALTARAVFGSPSAAWRSIAELVAMARAKSR